jgi:hypothetical protein
MNKALAALAILLASVSAALAQQSVIVPATMFSIAVSGPVGTTVLVNGIAGKSIYITNMGLVPADTSTWQFIAGTGGACAGGTISLTAIMTSGIGKTYTFGSGNGAVLVVPPGLNLCLFVGAAAVPGSIAYAQF